MISNTIIVHILIKNKKILKSLIQKKRIKYMSMEKNYYNKILMISKYKYLIVNNNIIRKYHFCSKFVRQSIDL